MSYSTDKSMRGLTIELTDDQKEALKDFWSKNGTLGNVEIKVDVVDDKISPASIQVGTAK